MANEPLIANLVERSFEVSRRVAWVLERCESIERPSADDVLGLLGQNPAFGSDPQFSRRAANLISNAWEQQVSPNSARRPDVLDLTCRLMANPDEPNSYEVARFALVLTLRSLYGIFYSNESLHELREQYDDIRARFAKQRRRQRKSRSPVENLLIDVLCMDKWIDRHLAPEDNRIAYYRGFARYPLGIFGDQRRQRLFADTQPGSRRWPELSGDLPDFGTILNSLFNQPTAVTGFDDVTGGLIPTVSAPNNPWKGGLVTLVAGPAGTGKTSLCLSITSRMAQLGARVRYIATEEEPYGIRAKLTALAESATTSLWPLAEGDIDEPEGHRQRDFRIVDGRDLHTFGQVVDKVRKEFGGVIMPPRERGTPQDVQLFLVFPRVLVIDSLTALLQFDPEFRSTSPRFDSSPSDFRRYLARTLNDLRELGVCIFLIGGLEDCDDEGLGYLVDNIFALNIESTLLPDKQPAIGPNSHQLRTLTIRKTRLQSSDRGRHVFHLSRQNGCTISPSLHSVLRGLKNRPLIRTDPKTRAIIWSYDSRQEPQMALKGMGRYAPPLTLRAHSQVLIYGRGSSGKARFAMSLAMEPRVPVEPPDSWAQYIAEHSSREHRLIPAEENYLQRLRILVVSFLYDRAYYEDLAAAIVARRFAKSKEAGPPPIDVLDFYPGFIDAETVAATVQRRLKRAQLEGLPYTAVVIDGVHNLLMQFPLLEREPLLWPTLYRMFRTEGLETITTFSFFEMARLSWRSENGATVNTPALVGADSEPAIGQSEALFFHVLVSSCDYNFLMERPARTALDRVGKNWVRVKLAGSVDGFGEEPEEFWWDPPELRYRGV